ncbi:MAG: DNA polymerase, partial [Candidatus Bathyarchaeia archaeon]
MDLREAFKRRAQIHIHNAIALWGPDALGSPPSKSHPRYREVKSAVHGTNYGASARTLAANLGWTTKVAEEFQAKWFSLHPAIKEWHLRVERDLQVSGAIRNAFGYRRVFFDRPESAFTHALAWIPQSTVALVTLRAANRIRRELPWAEILLQVHDSLLLQIPIGREDSVPKIVEAARVEVPYGGDPLVIPWSVKTSKESWGNTK